MTLSVPPATLPLFCHRSSLFKALLSVLLLVGPGHLHAAPPANDAIANATVLTGTSLAITSDNTEATEEPGDFASKTIWWKWQAPANGALNLTTANSARTLRLAVYLLEADDTVSSLIHYDGVNNVNHVAALNFPVKGGARFLIGLGSFSGWATGTVKLALSLTTSGGVSALPLAHLPTMQHDLFANRIALTGNNVSALAYTASAATETGEPPSAGYNTVWWTYRPAAKGVLTITTTHTDYSNKLVAAYLGDHVSNLCLISNGASQNGVVTLKFPVTPGTEYQLSMGGNYSTSYGTAIISLSLDTTAPVAALNIPHPATMENDNFASRLLLEGNSVAAIGYNGVGTVEAGEPATSGQRTFWWTYRPSAAGKVTITTQGSSTNPTFLYVYQGTELTTLRLVSGAAFYSPTVTVTFPVTADTDYHISFGTNLQSDNVNMVMSILNNTSDPVGKLYLPLPASTQNDLFSNRIVIPASQASVIGYNASATKETFEPAGAGERTLWWSWTAGADGTTPVDLTGTDVPNFVFSLWTGTEVGSLTPVPFVSELKFGKKFQAVAGTTYHIAVGSLHPDYPGSIVMKLTGLLSKPVLGLMPASRWLTTGGELRLKAASHNGSVTWQWQKNAAKISGATQEELVVSNATLATAGSYQAVASNTLGSTISDAVYVGVIDKTEAGVKVPEGGALTMTVPAAAPGLLSYQWRKGETDLANGKRGSQTISGSNSSKLSITKFSPADAGLYTCVVGMDDPAHPGTKIMEISGRFIVAVAPRPVVDAFTPGEWSVGQPVDSLQITAAHEPTKFTASGLPTGVKMDAKTGKLSGLPTTPKKVKGQVVPYQVKITATNAAGTSEAYYFDWRVEPLAPLVVGPFQGLLNREVWLNGAAGADTGFGGTIKVTTTANGSFSGTLTSGAAAHSFKGVLNTTGVNGDATAVVPIKRTRPLPDLSLTLTLDADTGSLSGSVKSGANNAGVTAWRTGADPLLTGAYNLALTANAAPDLPQGTGYMTVTISTKGAVTIKGGLADGTAFTGGGALGAGGRLPCHQMLYNKTGSIQGWVRITGTTIASTVPLDWLKNPQASFSPSYTDGFLLHLAAEGGRYVMPAAGFPVLGLPSALELVFNRGGAGGDFSQPVTLATKNLLVLPEGAVNAVTAKLNAATGVLTGSFTLPGAAPAEKPRKAIFAGALIPGRSEGAGYFLLPESSVKNAAVLSGQILLRASIF